MLIFHTQAKPFRLYFFVTVISYFPKYLLGLKVFLLQPHFFVFCFFIRFYILSVCKDILLFNQIILFVIYCTIYFSLLLTLACKWGKPRGYCMPNKLLKICKWLLFKKKSNCCLLYFIINIRPNINVKLCIQRNINKNMTAVIPKGRRWLKLPESKLWLEEKKLFAVLKVHFRRSFIHWINLGRVYLSHNYLCFSEWNK